MMTQIQGISIFDLYQIRQLSEIATQNFKGFDITDNFHIGITLQQALNLTTMIQLHVVNNQIIKLTISQNGRDPIQITTVPPRLDRIH